MCILTVSVKNTRPEVVKLAKNSGFHRKYILNQRKPIPLRVWGRLGPVRVSQILPCHFKGSTMFRPCFCLFLLAFLVLKFGNYAFEDFPGQTVNSNVKLGSLSLINSKKTALVYPSKIQIMYFVLLFYSSLVIST